MRHARPRASSPETMRPRGGGGGGRLGPPMAEATAGRPKQYLELLGEPVLLWALRPFLEHPAIGHRGGRPAAGRRGSAARLARARSPSPRWRAGRSGRDSVLERPRGAAGRTRSWCSSTTAPAPSSTPTVIDRVLAAAPEGGAVAAIPAVGHHQAGGRRAGGGHAGARTPLAGADPAGLPAARRSRERLPPRPRGGLARHRRRLALRALRRAGPGRARSGGEPEGHPAARPAASRRPLARARRGR